ncbi:MAG: NAD(P)/FAD-dependent oxidoreductase, partial [Clostridia bacterium]|nr:NAD(P)/FAD-dependent oxidoreductase [Clostridia bacterium]
SQVCAGGIACTELTGDLESRRVKNLFFAGEIIDVDGDCGGYNLQWAWSSAYVASEGVLKCLL